MKEKKAYRNFIVVIIFIMVFVPFIPLIVWSFSQRWAYPDLLPEFGMRAWKYIFTQNSIISGLFTSIWTSIVVTVISLLIGLPAAKALGMYKFKGKKLAETIVTLPAIVPSLAVVMGLQIIFIKIGLINTYLGVIIVHLIPTMPYMVMYLQSTFEDYQSDYEDQARVLGAGTFTTFTQITVPIIWPGIVVASLYSFLVSWSQYLLTVMIGGANVKTLPTILFSFLGSGDNAVSAAVSLVFILPAIVMLLLSSKYLSGNKSQLAGGNKV